MYNEEALNAFICRSLEIQEHINRLQSFNDRAHDVDPNWSDVATVGHIAEKLAEIIAFAFDEAE